MAIGTVGLLQERGVRLRALLVRLSKASVAPVGSERLSQFRLIRDGSAGFMLGCHACSRRLAAWSERCRPAEGRRGKRVDA